MLSSLHYDSASKVGRLLQSRQWSLSVAESCTGGLISAAITEVPGASSFYKGGVIAYSNDVKENILHVPKRILLEHGAVSAQTVRAMASGVARLMGTDCAISISGIAGPSGGTPDKPVGLVYMGFVTPEKQWESRYVFSGDRRAVRGACVEHALKNLIDSSAKDI